MKFRKTILGCTAAAIVAASGLVGAAAPATAAAKLDLTVTPANGNDITAIDLITSNSCADRGATNIIVKVTGPGFPKAGQNVVGNTEITAFTRTDTGGLVIPLVDTMRAFANRQSPAAPLKGTYEFTAICRQAIDPKVRGEFHGAVKFSGPQKYTAIKATVVAPSPAASAPANDPSTGSSGGGGGTASNPGNTTSPTTAPTTAPSTGGAGSSPSTTSTATPGSGTAGNGEAASAAAAEAPASDTATAWAVGILLGLLALIGGVAAYLLNRRRGGSTTGAA